MVDFTYKNFDYEGARKAGYSQEEIVEFLKTKQAEKSPSLSVSPTNTVAESAKMFAEDMLQEGFAIGVAADELVKLIFTAGGTLSDGILGTVRQAAEKNQLVRKQLFSILPDRLSGLNPITDNDKARIKELTTSTLKGTFDVEGALNAGYTRQEVDAFIKAKSETPTKKLWREKAKKWKGWMEGATFSNLPIKALDEYYEAIGQRDSWEQFKNYQNNAVEDTTVMKGFALLGEKLQASSEAIEGLTGIPSEATLAASELLLLKARVPKVLSERATGLSDKAIAKETIRKKEEMVGPLGEKYDVTKERNDFNNKRFGFISGIEKAPLVTKEISDPTQLVNDYIFEKKRDTLNQTLKKIENEKELIEATEMTVKNASKIDETHSIRILRSVRNDLGIPLQGSKGIESLYKIRDYYEWHPKIGYARPKLTPKEMKIYKNTFQPLGKLHKQFAKKMQKYGLLERPVKFEKGFNFLSRMRERPKKSIKEMLTGDRARIQDPYAREVRSGASGAREYFVAVDKNGNRTPFGYTDNGATISTWTPFKNKEGRAAFELNKELSDLQKVAKTDGSGQKLGQYTIKEATAKELENASGYIKHVDPLASELIRLNEMAQDLRLYEYNNSIMESPFIKQEVFQPKTKTAIASDDFKVIAEDIGRINEPLRQHKFKVKTAEILEDAFRTRKDSYFTIVSNAMVKNMMLNSLPHMHNELIHWYLSRGMMRTFDPRSIASFRKEMIEATQDVLGRSDFYKALLKENSSMMGTNISNTLYMDKILRDTTKSVFPPKDLKGYASLTGRSLAEVYSNISDFSNLAMWQVRDILFVQLIKEKMRKDNIDMKEAVFRVEQHMPTYRLPTRIGEKPLRLLGKLIGNAELGSSMARSLSKTLQNPNIVIFARYKHGMIKSAMNTVKDMYGSKDIRGSRTAQKQIMDGMDSALAMASAMYVIYPMMDYIFSNIFGDNSAVMRRAGFLHILQTLGYVTDGTKDMKALQQNLLTVNPAAMLLGEIALNQTYYNGQPVYYTDDPASQIAVDIGKKLVSTIPQVSAIATSGDVDGKWFARQIDVKLKGYEGQVKEERRRQLKEKARLRREAERAADLR